MACVRFSLLVLISLSYVLATPRNCSDIEKNKSCDECIRCGGTWCFDKDKVNRCVMVVGDNCADQYRPLDDLKEVEVKSSSGFNPIHTTKPVGVNDGNGAVNIEYTGTNNLRTIVSFVNSSIPNLNYNDTSVLTFPVYVEKDGRLEIYINTGFCPAESDEETETVTFMLQRANDNATVTFIVPCACACSKKVKPNSPECNNGSLSCGLCTCKTGWNGPSCKNSCDRGDIVEQCMYKGQKCSNNGVCGCDGVCECNKTLPGSYYFDNFCTNICDATSDCDSCLIKPILGKCKDCPHIFIDHLNDTKLSEKNVNNLDVWLYCTDHVSDTCDIKYAAMRVSANEIHAMIIESNCIDYTGTTIAGGIGGGTTGGGTTGGGTTGTGTTGGSGGTTAGQGATEASVNVTVPVVVGVLAVVAAGTVVAAYMVMKNRVPAMQPTDPAYTNIGAEDCTGINPLYRPPTSSFKNPTYGKNI